MEQEFKIDVEKDKLDLRHTITVNVTKYLRMRRLIGFMDALVISACTASLTAIDTDIILVILIPYAKLIFVELPMLHHRKRLVVGI